MSHAVKDDQSQRKGITMAKDVPTEPIAPTDAPDAPAATDGDDTEGHSLGLLMGINALSQAHDADARSRTKRIPEEELAPLTKEVAQPARSEEGLTAL